MRKPIDQQQPSECRQAIWECIRVWHGPFTVNDILMSVRLDASSVKEYLSGLVNAPERYLTAIKAARRGDPNLYMLNNDCGHDAPRVRKDGSAVTMGQGRLQIWNAMRVLKTGFNTTDLAFNASTDDCRFSESEVRTYLTYLLGAGYLRLMAAGKPGHKRGTGAQARYMLIPSMWTGPNPPQIQRTKQVYDPNLRRVVWSRIEGGAE